MTTRTRSIVLAAALALALPGSTLAASTSGSSPESLSVAATISMVVPASIAYTGTGTQTAAVSISGLDTNNPTGLAVTATVNATGAGKITPASRSLSAVTVGSGWTGSAANPAPWSTGSEAVTLATYPANAPAAKTISFTSSVNASAYAPGAFTGSMNFTAITNP